MKIGYISSTIAIAALAGGALFAAQQQEANRSMPTERSFAQELARGNIAEIELGKLAQQKGSNEAVKDFGSRMVNDHTQLNNQLKEWARTNGVSLPTAVSSAQADQKRKLEGMSGQAFDRAYIDYMLSDHQNDVKEVQHAAETAQDPQIKQLAEKTLPELQDHLRLAENVAGKIGVDAGKGLNDSTRK